MAVIACDSENKRIVPSKRPFYSLLSKQNAPNDLNPKLHRRYVKLLLSYWRIFPTRPSYFREPFPFHQQQARLAPRSQLRPRFFNDRHSVYTSCPPDIIPNDAFLRDSRSQPILLIKLTSFIQQNCYHAPPQQKLCNT